MSGGFQPFRPYHGEDCPVCRDDDISADERALLRWLRVAGLLTLLAVGVGLLVWGCVG